MGNTNPFEDEDYTEADKHDATPEVELAEYVTDNDNDDQENDGEVDLSEENYEELEQEREAEDISMDLSLSGLSKSIQQPEREARTQLGHILDG